MSQKIQIAPSILAADFARLGEEVQAAQTAGADWIHVDVMDGQFVPNITMGPVVVRALRSVTTLPLDVHLMISEPERFIESFADAGADSIIIHVEATPHIHRAVQMIHDLGKKAGIAINPGTPIEALRETASSAEIILIMSVNPGFGGQRFIKESLDKTARIRTLLREIGNPDAEITLDGGVGPDNASQIVAAGGTVLVAGNSVFGSELGIHGAIANLKQAARAGSDARPV